MSAIGVKAQEPSREGPVIPQKSKSEIVRPSLSKIYTSVDVDKFPEFPGGMDAFGKFLAKNLKWPNGDEDVMGRVILSFVIERDGRISNLKTERSLSRKLDAEAVRALKLSPRWTPGVKNGYLVRVRYFVPINFEYGKT